MICEKLPNIIRSGRTGMGQFCTEGFTRYARKRVAQDE